MLEQIRLEHFKSFEEADIVFGQLTLIVGTNASGKSNIRDALRVLHGIGLGYPLAEILGEKYGPGGILTWRGIRGGAREAAQFGHSRFKVECWIEEHYHSITIDLSKQTTGPQLVDECLYANQSYLWDSSPFDDPVDQYNEHALRVRFPRGGSHRGHGPISNYALTRPVLAQIAEGREHAG